MEVLSIRSTKKQHLIPINIKARPFLLRVCLQDAIVDLTHYVEIEKLIQNKFYIFGGLGLLFLFLLPLYLKSCTYSTTKDKIVE